MHTHRSLSAAVHSAQHNNNDGSNMNCCLAAGSATDVMNEKEYMDATRRIDEMKACVRPEHDTFRTARL